MGNGRCHKPRCSQGYEATGAIPCCEMSWIPDQMQGCVDCHDAQDKAFCGSMDGGAGKSMISREYKHRLGMHTYSSGDTYLPPLWWKRSDVINPPTGGWLGLPRNGTVSGAQG